MNNITTLFITVVALLLPFHSFAQEHVVNAEARIFKPDTLYIQPGDTVVWRNMTSHNAVSYVKPEGTEGFGEKGKLPGGSFNASFEQEGIYGYVCEPHIGFGMVGVIAVGKITQEMIDAAMKDATDNLQGPFRRLIGKIKKLTPQ